MNGRARPHRRKNERRPITRATAHVSFRRRITCHAGISYEYLKNLARPTARRASIFAPGHWRKVESPWWCVRKLNGASCVSVGIIRNRVKRPLLRYYIPRYAISRIVSRIYIYRTHAHAHVRTYVKSKQIILRAVELLTRGAFNFTVSGAACLYPKAL